ncbi:penicillin-binding transpeptidase domain-containing protein [Nocardiopsis ansamitocini]|uniref:Penicillin-binding protein n=1 Tax=Nocardiopsis ansamitocini TaxID=1670832 RepID=A0A9W6PA00_9ACTN|nr:penicillin-binding transpeptidase domain-containing protein [Nocardiopsis ansamitocini]GLU49702.1 penicillin-binding protein [Nocardiopsis ansamitocini]
MSPRHIRRFLAGAMSLAAVAAVTGCAAEPSPEVAVRHFLLDWQAGDYEAAARQTDGDTTQVAQSLEQAHDQLDLAALRLSLGPIDRDGDAATAAFGVQADLGIGDPVWNYEGAMPLSRTASGWAINWSPSVIHPELGEGERLAVTYDVPDRGQIYDRDEQPLIGETRVTAFGVRPAKLSDMTEDVNSLAELLEEEAEPLLSRVRSAPPEEFQPLVLMRTADVDSRLLAQAKRITGVETANLRMPLTPKGASAVMGEVAGTAEHKVSNRVSGPYQAGDTIGLSGLQNSYQERLAGTATTRIVTLDTAGNETGVLSTWDGTASGSLTTTIDSGVQAAAEESLATVTTNAYLVAVDARTGEILASAARPSGTYNDGGFTKEYLPGDAFTIVSTAAMLEAGTVTGETQVSCELSTKVGNLTFDNTAGTSLWGPRDLTTAFANNCTTGFAGLADKADSQAMAETAGNFGIGNQWQLSVPTFSGEFTPPGNAEETASAIVGAQQVTVSPLTMALVAGAVADGRWHAPRLVPEDQRETTEPGPELAPAVVEPLREMMRASVVSGTSSIANVGIAAPVHGQRGVARQEIDGADTAVQWFVGYQGQVAFALVVETDPANTYHFALNSARAFVQLLPSGYVQEIGAEAQADGAEGVPGA